MIVGMHADSFGHGVGDEVLADVARRLDAELRRDEGVMRLAGDEFAFIVEDVPTESELAVVARRILSAVAEPLAVEGGVGQVTATLGIALAEPGDTPTSLLHKADIAMYRVKAELRGRFGFYSREPAGLPPPRGRRHATPSSSRSAVRG